MQPREQGDTGVDVGSHETAPARRSADPGRLRGRCLAARGLAARGLAAGLLVAGAGLLALPLQARGPEGPSFVSNTGQSTARHSSLGASVPPASGVFFTPKRSGSVRAPTRAGYTLTRQFGSPGRYSPFESASSPRVNAIYVYGQHPFAQSAAHRASAWARADQSGNAAERQRDQHLQGARPMRPSKRPTRRTSWCSTG